MQSLEANRCGIKEFAMENPVTISFPSASCDSTELWVKAMVVPKTISEWQKYRFPITKLTFSHASTLHACKATEIPLIYCMICFKYCLIFSKKYADTDIKKRV